VTGTRSTGVVLIGAFKLVKGLLLVAIGIGALRLLDKDVSDVVATWIEALRVDPDNRHIDKLLVKLWSVDNHKLKEISAGTFFYAALVFTEGFGLLSGRRWGQYFTIVITASFIPLETYELMRKLSPARAITLGINVLILWYLVAHLAQSRDRKGADPRPG
jgi:uncharacterized membrane protein (DUF2068 family)